MAIVDIDMVVIIDDSTWEVEKFEKGGMWYSYNNAEAPIIYTVFQRSPERPLVLHQPYTAFTDERGNGFNNDEALQAHLDEVLAPKEVEFKLETTPHGKDNLLLVRDEDTTEILKDILIELKINNIHLSNINGENFTLRDI